MQEHHKACIYVCCSIAGQNAQARLCFGSCHKQLTRPSCRSVPEAFALSHDVVGQVCIHVCCPFVALLSNQISQLLLVIVCKVALPLASMKPLHLQEHPTL